jgi:Uma2 family endonuclease
MSRVLNTSESPHPRLPGIQKTYHPETDRHALGTARLYLALVNYFQDTPDVYVSSRRPVHYEPDDPTALVIPDIFIVRGVAKKNRRTLNPWEEKSPDLAIEFTSHSAWLEDMGTKRALYAELGVAEYFIYDPIQEYLKPPLQGYRLAQNDYAPIAPDAHGKFHSAILDLDLQIVNDDLRLFDPRTQKFLLTPLEAQEEVERLRAELKKLRGE